MLRIYILDVGHGDSIVLERRRPDGASSFAVIDSNCKAGSQPRALSLLQSLEAKSLSFAAITHPHADHYMGMRAIFQYFSGNIENLYTFPIKQESDFLKKVVEAYKEIATRTDDKPLQGKMAELAHILLLARNAAKYWETPSGFHNAIAAPGFDDVKIFTILPPAKVKGSFFEDVLNGKLQPEAERLNDLSVAFLIEYGGHQIVLGGDGTYENWHYHGKRWPAAGISLSPIAVKLPHHGSKRDSGPSVQNLIFGEGDKQQTEAVACISANGKSHPSAEVLDELVRRGIRPYCTNLAKRCGSNIQSLVSDPNTDPALLRFINATVDDESHVQPCQGDIVLEFEPGKAMTVSTQHKLLCGFRGEYDFLAKMIQ